MKLSDVIWHQTASNKEKFLVAAENALVESRQDLNMLPSFASVVLFLRGSARELGAKQICNKREIPPSGKLRGSHRSLVFSKVFVLT